MSRGKKARQRAPGRALMAMTSHPSAPHRGSSRSRPTAAAAPRWRLPRSVLGSCVRAARQAILTPLHNNRCCLLCQQLQLTNPHTQPHTPHAPTHGGKDDAAGGAAGRGGRPQGSAAAGGRADGRRVTEGFADPGFPIWIPGTQLCTRTGVVCSTTAHGRVPAAGWGVCGEGLLAWD